jgi:CheY-like chemotaxis protein
LAQKILLADDSVTAQNMGRRILSEAGYEVITVNNGSAALKKIAESKPDLIILDVYMPGYGGLEVCQRVKDDPETARIPVLLTVGKLEPFRADEARRVHADAHLVKPFEASELLTALSKLEDKIVPRAEPRQTGAPGRTSTAGRPSTSARGADFGDSATGWKRRLAIPGLSKLSEPATPSQKNTAFRHFQRVEDQASAETPATTPTLASMVQDITAEEIAAISAAAAALGEKASLAESELASRPAGWEDSARSVAATPEPVSESVIEIPSPADAEPVALEAASVGDADRESENESLAQATSAEPPVQSAEAQVPVESVVDSEVVAALESLVPRNGDQACADGFADAEPGVHDRVEEPQEVPIGSAVAGVGSGRVRWIAEEVPLAEEDAAFILEREMQKVFAALADLNIEPGSVANVPSEPPSFSASSDPFPAADREPVVSQTEPDSVEASGESYPAFLASSEASIPVTAEAGNNLASGSVELEPAVEAAVKLEQNASQEAPEISESAPAAGVEVVAQPVMETQGTETQAGTGESEPAPEAEAAEPITVASETAAEAEPEAAYAAAAAASVSASFRSIRTADAISQPVPAPVEDEGGAAAEVPASGPPEREAELAAAWAQWRQIRDSMGSPSPGSPASGSALAAEPTSGFKDIQRPTPAQPPSPTPSREPADPAAIASIVDSMLAELRPKLVEEIARKMGQEREREKK